MNQRISYQGIRPQFYISQRMARCVSRLPVLKIEFKALIAIFRLWAQRARDRKQLARMDDYLLQDIGISRFDAMAEANKPFWKE